MTPNSWPEKLSLREEKRNCVIILFIPYQLTVVSTGSPVSNQNKAAASKVKLTFSIFTDD